MIETCRHCGRVYRGPRKPFRVVPALWLSTAEHWQDVINERQDFCPCRAAMVPVARPKQATLFDGVAS